MGRTHTFAVAVLAALASVGVRAEEQASDRRVHVRAGQPAGSDPIVLTAAGAKVAFASSFAISDNRFVPDPYEEKCSRKAVKYTLKTADQKEILGAGAAFPDPDSEDALVLHPTELRNAAAKFGANAIYLMLSDSDELAREKGLHDCAIIDRSEDRVRGESMQEVVCRSEQGVKLTFSRYAGQARFYACPAPAGK